MLTYGTDPEIFILNSSNYIESPALLERKGKIESIGGTIKHPVYLNRDIYFWHGDGAAMELGIKTPVYSAEELNHILNCALADLNDLVTSLSNSEESYYLSYAPAGRINVNQYKEFLSEEKVHYGFIMGCDEDFDAILPDYQCKKVDSLRHKYRYAGGHFHVGSLNPEIIKNIHETINPFIQLLAVFIGNKSIASSEFPEEEKLRIETYGKPGRFRPQDWGAEYRTPSNSWITNIQTMRDFISYSEICYDLIGKPEIGIQVLRNFLPDTIKAITSCDGFLAYKTLTDAKEFYNASCI